MKFYYTHKEINKLIKGVRIYNIAINEYLYNNITYEFLFIIHFMSHNSSYIDLFNMLSDDHNLLKFKADLCTTKHNIIYGCDLWLID